MFKETSIIELKTVLDIPHVIKYHQNNADSVILYVCIDNKRVCIIPEDVQKCCFECCRIAFTHTTWDLHFIY